MRHVGLDIGTGFIACAEEEEGKVVYRKTRDAFLKVDPSKFMAGMAKNFGEKMLDRAGAHYMKVDGLLHILGDDAFKFATMLHQECQRPMAKGVLNAKEPVASQMVLELVKAVVGPPTAEDDNLCYCIPAEPIDADYDVEFHEKTLHTCLSDLGYKNISVMTEGQAIVFSELKDTGYTGIGMSFGAGMVNVCYSFLGMPIFSFSLSRSGDWIDQNAANNTDDTANMVAALKEKGMDLNDPKTHTEKAIAIYYEALMRYIIEQFQDLYARTPKTDLPGIIEPMPIIVAGGTSMAGNFVSKFHDMIKEGFPVEISEVRHAREPLYSVCRGLYEASRED